MDVIQGVRLVKGREELGDCGVLYNACIFLKCAEVEGAEVGDGC